MSLLEILESPVSEVLIEDSYMYAFFFPTSSLKRRIAQYKTGQIIRLKTFRVESDWVERFYLGCNLHKRL